MRKQYVKWIIIIGLLSIFIIILFQPIIFKKNFIEKIIKIELPNTIEIIDCKFGFNPYGIEPFYAKIKIDQDTYESINKKLIGNMDFIKYVQDEVVPRHNYKSLNFENTVEIKANELLSSKYYLMVAGTTRVIYYIITKENMGMFYLYVFY